MKCILCKNEKTKKILVKNKKSQRVFFRCESCDFCFLERGLLLSPLQEKERYLLHQNSTNNQGYVNWLTSIISESSKIIDLNEKDILDYGCGHNPILKQILENKIKKVKTIDFYDLYFFPKLNNEKKYSCVFAIEVFEHFRDVYEEIRKIISLVSQGGYLVLSTNFLLDEKDFNSWWYIQDMTHISFYSEKTIDYLSKFFSLEVVFSNEKNLVILKKL